MVSLGGLPPTTKRDTMPKVTDVQKHCEQLAAHTAQVLPSDELLEKLKTGKPLKIKFGADPTAPDLHLGHAVVLSKLRQFQDFGHEIIFLIGDFTARIGDPTGRSKTRPPLSDAEIKHNAQTYFEQVGKILDPAKTTICYNSTWLSKLNFADLLSLCAKTTVARIIEREDFKKRLSENTPIGLHELLYPLMQAYDSVALKADVEIGGTDQTFNLLMGRFLQEQFGQRPQTIVTLPLLEGLDGSLKMSKSAGNYIGLRENPSDAYGKLMSISDDLMWRYFALLLSTPASELSSLRQEVNAGTRHPMTLKKKMAFDIVSKFWSPTDAAAGQHQFEALFQNRELTEAPEIKIAIASPCWIVDLLKATNAVASTSDAKRLIDAGAVILDDTTISSFEAKVTWKPGSTLRVGKKKMFKLSR
jgi:tyrosyl-tRNA synthetase